MVIHAKDSVLVMAANNKPVAHCASGSTVVFEALDCFSGELTSEEKHFSAVGWDKINPATGPLYVEGACPGDILLADILNIQLSGRGVMGTAPGLGALQHWNLHEKTKILPLADGKAVFNAQIALECHPMIGVIGTAPSGAGIPTGTPGMHGGNMDCAKISVGSRVFLPVCVPGALLAVGDIHAVMGDGEIMGCGVETAATVTLNVRIITDTALPLPMVLQNDTIMAIASAESLDEAAVMASEHMCRFLQTQLGCDIHEAGMLLSAAGQLRVCQIVDPLKTARMEFPLEILRQANRPFLYGANTNLPSKRR